MKPTLLVLAAGMGSRYGGLKQMDGLGPNGETIIDYSIYDAVQAGLSLRRQERQIEQYQRENAELDRRIRVMTGDRDSLERYAREEFFFAEPGDDVYITE